MISTWLIKREVPTVCRLALSTLSRRIGSFNILLCLTLDDFSHRRVYLIARSLVEHTIISHTQNYISLDRNGNPEGLVLVADGELGLGATAKGYGLRCYSCGELRINSKDSTCNWKCDL